RRASVERVAVRVVHAGDNGAPSEIDDLYTGSAPGQHIGIGADRSNLTDTNSHSSRAARFQLACQYVTIDEDDIADRRRAIAIPIQHRGSLPSSSSLCSA